LKTFFSKGDDLEQRKAELELNFKKLLQQCKVKLNQIFSAPNSTAETAGDESRGETEAKVTENVTQSILIKMQELNSEFISYKSR